MINVPYRVKKANGSIKEVIKSVFNNAYHDDINIDLIAPVLMTSLAKKGYDFDNEASEQYVNPDKVKSLINDYYSRLTTFEDVLESRLRLGIKLMTNGADTDFNEVNYSKNKTGLLKVLSQLAVNSSNKDYNINCETVKRVLEERFNVTFFYDKDEIAEGKIYVNPYTLSKEFSEAKSELKDRREAYDLLTNKLFAGIYKTIGGELNKEGLTSLIYLTPDNDSHSITLDVNYWLRNSSPGTEQFINLNDLLTSINLVDKEQLSSVIKEVLSETGASYNALEVLEGINKLGLSIDSAYFNEVFAELKESLNKKLNDTVTLKQFNSNVDGFLKSIGCPYLEMEALYVDPKSLVSFRANELFGFMELDGNDALLQFKVNYLLATEALASGNPQLTKDDFKKKLTELPDDDIMDLWLNLSDGLKKLIA